MERKPEVAWLKAMDRFVFKVVEELLKVNIKCNCAEILGFT